MAMGTFGQHDTARTRDTAQQTHESAKTVTEAGRDRLLFSQHFEDNFAHPIASRRRQRDLSDVIWRSAGRDCRQRSQQQRPARIWPTTLLLRRYWRMPSVVVV